MTAKKLQEKHLQSIPGADDITRAELKNGIVVLARHNPHSLSVTVRGFLQVGGIYDPDEKLGLADFVSSALMRGSEKRDFHSLYDALESIGASAGFSSGTHTTGLSGRSLAEDLDLVLDLLNETLRQPSFPLEQIEKLRAQLLTGLALRGQSTKDMASLVFDQIVYRDHPYSRPDEGHAETVSAILRDDLAEFHARHYGPHGMVLAIVGGVEPEEAIDKVRKAFEDWENPEQPDEPGLPKWKPLPMRSYERYEIGGKSQSDLIIGTAGPRRKSPHYLPAAVGNNIFGQLGLMGRIGDAVREQAGLAYYAYGSLGSGIGPGPWTVQAGVNPANEEQASELIFSEIERFTIELVEEGELSDSISNMVGGMPLSLESNGGVAQALLNIERYGLGLDYYREFPDKVKAINQEQIREVAAKYLDPEKLAVAVAGPERDEG